MSRAGGLTTGFALVIAVGRGVSNAAAQTDRCPRGGDRRLPEGLPSMPVFLVALSNWSDGTAVQHDELPPP